MAFDPSLLDTLRQRAALSEVAGAATRLRRQGDRYVGRCPLHQERTPSFHIDAKKNLFHCFGCQAGGDVFAFVMQLHGIGFVQAVHQLAETYRLDVGRSEAEKKHAAQAMAQHRTLEAVQRIFVHQLGTAEAQPARTLLRERGVAPAVAKAYGLGFGGSPAAFAKRATQAGLRDEALAQAGLSAPHKSGVLFAHRLTFPIAGLAGEVHGFGGRRLGENEHEPKYINSRDCERFHKHEELFGLAQAAAAMRRRQSVILCEGYLDVMALMQAGLPQAVAALGTALSGEHVQKLARLVQHVTLAFDGDAAGKKAAQRAYDALKQAQLRVSVAVFDQGDDPASCLARLGPQRLLARIEAAKPALEHFVTQAFVEAGPSIEGKVAAARAVGPLVMALPSALERQLHAARIAERVGSSPEALQREWQALAARPHNKPAALAPAKRHAPGPPATRQGPAPGGDGPATAPLAPEGPALPPMPPDFPSAWNAKASEALAEQELGMVRELLLHPAAWPGAEPLLEYVYTPELHAFLTQLVALPAGPTTAERWQKFDTILTQCITRPRHQFLLRAAVPTGRQALDEGDVRANRTRGDILRRLQRRQVDWALRRVLGDLADLERRGEATDALLRRKQHLAATKRALGRTPR